MLSNDQKRLVKIYVEKYIETESQVDREEKRRIEEELVRFDEDFRAALAQQRKVGLRRSSAVGKHGKSHSQQEQEVSKVNVKQADGSSQEVNLDALISDISARLDRTDLDADDDKIVLQGDNIEAILSVVCKRLDKFTIEPDISVKSDAKHVNNIQKTSTRSTKGKTGEHEPSLSSTSIPFAKTYGRNSGTRSTRGIAQRKINAKRNLIERNAIYTNIDKLERAIEGFEPDARPEHDMPVDQRLRRNGEWRPKEEDT